MEIPQEVLDKVGLDAEMRAMAESAAAKFAAADGDLDPEVAAEEAVAESEETARAADAGGYEMDWLPPVAVPGGISAEGATKIAEETAGDIVSGLDELTVVTSIYYDLTDYKIKAERKKVTIQNGKLTVAAAATQEIETIPLSSEMTA